LHESVLIPGDGIGPEVTEAATRTIQATGANINFIRFDIGEKTYKKSGEIVPAEVFEAMRKVKIALKGPVVVPIGSGMSSANSILRRNLDLFASVRISKPLGRQCQVPERGLIVIKDNLGGHNLHLEHFVDRDETIAEAILVTSMKDVKRLTDFAFDYCKQNGRKKLTVVTLADGFKLTDGMWLRVAREVKDAFCDIEYEELLADDATSKLALKPWNFDVILTNDIWGETLCSLCSALVGSAGMSPNVNVGNEVVMFETVHGAAPRIAGKNMANPTAAIFAGALLLKHLHEDAKAEAVERALSSVISEGKVLTYDLGGKATTTQFTDEVISKIN